MCKKKYRLCGLCKLPIFSRKANAIYCKPCYRKRQRIRVNAQSRVDWAKFNLKQYDKVKLTPKLRKRKNALKQRIKVNMAILLKMRKETLKRMCEV